MNISPDMNLVSIVNKLVAYSKDQQYQNTALRMAQTESAGMRLSRSSTNRRRPQKAVDDKDAADQSRRMPSLIELAGGGK